MSYNNQRKHSSDPTKPIRNVQAFLTSFFKGDHGQRLLNRPPATVEYTKRDRKGEYKYREFVGGNQMAYALSNANYK